MEICRRRGDIRHSGTKKCCFIPEVDPAMTVTMNEVKHRGTDAVLLDSRAEERYLGKWSHYIRKLDIYGSKKLFLEKCFSRGWQLERQFSTQGKF